MLGKNLKLLLTKELKVNQHEVRAETEEERS